MGSVPDPFGDPRQTCAAPSADARASAVVFLKGELDLSQLPYVWSCLSHAVASGFDSAVVVDLSGVTFMDCSALRPLVAAFLGLAGRLQYRGATDQVARLFTITGQGHLLTASPPGAAPAEGSAGTTGEDQLLGRELLSVFATAADVVLSAGTVSSALHLGPPWQPRPSAGPQLPG